MPSLLDALAKATVLDLDSNDEKVAALYPKGTFLDMTSNQAILWGDLQKQHLKEIVPESVREAQKLVEQEVEGAKNRDPALVAVDVMTIKLGLRVLPYLQPTGRLHAQSTPTGSSDLQLTLKHARNLVALYKHYGVPKERICIKVPSSLAGLRACKILESEGIRTLATTVFCDAQALAAGEAGCLYIAPYLNPLRVHFLEGSHVVVADPLTLASYKVTADAQRAFRKKGLSTQVLAASLVTIPEALSLAGLAHSTLSPAVLALLVDAPLTPEYEKILAASEAFYAPDSTEPGELAPVYSLDEPAEALVAALKDPRVDALMKEAIEIFGSFELQLSDLARRATADLGERDE